MTYTAENPHADGSAAPGARPRQRPTRHRDPALICFLDSMCFFCPRSFLLLARSCRVGCRFWYIGYCLWPIYLRNPCDWCVCKGVSSYLYTQCPLSGTRSPWFCCKSKGVSSYSYTEDGVIVVFGQCAYVFLGYGCCNRLFVLAVRSPYSLGVSLEEGYCLLSLSRGGPWFCSRGYGISAYQVIIDRLSRWYCQ
jgi:hypothetical protein